MQIWLQLGAAALLVPLCAFLHGLGLMLVSKLFGLQDDALKERSLDLGSFHLIGVIGFALFSVHAVEIAVFGFFYTWVGAAPDVEAALFFSASSYTTAGAGADRLPDGWKLVGEAEAVLGLLLVGWSTAYLVNKIEKLRN